MTVFYHEIYRELTQSPGHPECPERVDAIVARLQEVISEGEIITPTPATEDQLMLVHDETYVDFIKNFGTGHMDADSYIHDHTFDMAIQAAGGAIQAADFSFSKKKPSYAIVRPPGHHSGVDYGGGFCYFNNAALAAASLLDKCGRVAVVDIDVHHGNGTNDIFEFSKDVLYISTHQYGIYPGTGHFNDVGGEGAEGFNVNIPLPSRSGDATFDAAYDNLIIPILKEFKPEAMIISFGGDAHYMDMLASLTLSSPGYLSQLSKLLKLASEMCDNRVSFMLEGGYHIGAQAEVVCGTLALFKNVDFPTQYNEVSDEIGIGMEWVEKAVEVQSAYWSI
ncbi:MAG: histone deacetylase [Thermoplasmata archaeon]|nr:histone deacetylase [Thermoplasmata archaeon]